MALMKLSQFIEKVLINEINIIVQSKKSPYLCFLLIAAGIELLGSCTNKHFQKEKRLVGIKKPEAGNAKNTFTEKMFKNGIGYFNDGQGREYSQKKDILYHELRCGMAHVLLPDSRVKLTTSEEASYSGIQHLRQKDGDGFTYLVLEEFNEDFNAACKKVINNIRSNKNGLKDFDVLEITPLLNKNGISTLTHAVTGSVPSPFDNVDGSENH